MAFMIFTVLVFLTFLHSLNGFLRGQQKAAIDAILKLLIMVLIGISFIALGWKSGLLSPIIVFLANLLTKPLAVRVAARLFAVNSLGPTGKHIGCAPTRLHKISKILGDLSDPTKLLNDEWSDRYDRAERDLYDYCIRNTNIKAMMDDNNLNQNDLKEFYMNLLKAGAGQWVSGHWVPASALAHSDTLQYLIKRKHLDPETTAFRLISYFEHGAILE